VTKKLGTAHLQTPTPGQRRPHWAYSAAEVKTSGAPLNTVENMPPAIEPRPDLRVFNCEYCIQAWGELDHMRHRCGELTAHRHGERGEESQGARRGLRTGGRV
jgi:hypothetical protein